MPYKVKLDLPNAGPNTAVFLGGLGEFVNGQERVISDIDADVFFATYGRSLEKHLSSIPGATVEKFTEAKDEKNEKAAAPKARASRANTKEGS
jgi:hypothetical protein